MYKGARVLAFLLVFLSIVTAPLFLNWGKTTAAPEITVDKQAAGRVSGQGGAVACVEPVEIMSSEHMQLLGSWRDLVVREGKTHYVSSDGRMFEMSLDDSCLSCHSNREEFCDSCHEYMSVEPSCWNCHDGAQTIGGE
ncbi:MAG: sulfate reduction electron transfer complex DsrMKJOP subunit DsrJ [Coriobacteriales bacterium]|jgi:hypothetical protein|nr:sulfate reduction electron transfer complex DsrMKJOP subunit DsrJ [Coriobacteriales bacterium]